MKRKSSEVGGDSIARASGGGALSGFIIGMYGFRAIRRMLVSNSVTKNGGVAMVSESNKKDQKNGSVLSHLVIEKITGEKLEAERDKAICEFQACMNENTKVVSP